MSNTSKIERIYTVPLSRAWIGPKQRRAKRAVTILKEFTSKHMKTDKVNIQKDVNEALWKKGIGSPPRKIQVKMIKDEEGVVEVFLIDHEFSKEIETTEEPETTEKPETTEEK